MCATRALAHDTLCILQRKKSFTREFVEGLLPNSTNAAWPYGMLKMPLLKSLFRTNSLVATETMQMLTNTKNQTCNRAL